MSSLFVFILGPRKCCIIVCLQSRNRRQATWIYYVCFVARFSPDSVISQQIISTFSECFCCHYMRTAAVCLSAINISFYLCASLLPRSASLAAIRHLIWLTFSCNLCGFGGKRWISSLIWNLPWWHRQTGRTVSRKFLQIKSRSQVSSHTLYLTPSHYLT